MFVFKLNVFIFTPMNETQKDTKLVVSSADTTGFDDLVAGFDSLQKYAELIMKSKAYNKQLESVDDVMNAIIIGREIGISPMTAIMLGKKLNANKVFSVIKGRGMGIDPITAIENIHIIPTSNGDVSVTGVHIISSQLVKAGVKLEILEDYTPLYKYIDAKGQRYDIDLVNSRPEKFHINGTSGDSEGKTVVALGNNPSTYQTTIRFTRKLNSGLENVISISYNLEQATIAGLYKGKHPITGVEVNGKGNWNENPATMLRNRCISLGGRIIASDYLQGVYEFSEIIKDNDKNFATVVEEGKTILTNKEGKVISGDTEERSE